MLARWGSLLCSHAFCGSGLALESLAFAMLCMCSARPQPYLLQGVPKCSSLSKDDLLVLEGLFSSYESALQP